MLWCFLILVVPIPTVDSFGAGLWSSLRPSGITPPSSVYHSSSSIGDNVYITGGSAGKAGGTRTVFYNAFNNEWVSDADTGAMKHDAQVASMDASGGVLYLFGGKNTITKPIDPDSSGIMNELYLLRTVTAQQKWQTVQPLNPPSPRNGHSTTAAAGMLIVFGGWDETQYFNSLHGLDLTELVLPGQQNDATPLSWFTFTTSTAAEPPARNSHTMCAVGHELLLFGGFAHDIAKSGAFTQCPKDDQCKYFDDLWSLRLQNDHLQIEWQQIAPTGNHKPLARWWHAASSVGDRMYIYGEFGFVVWMCFVFPLWLWLVIPWF